MNDCRINDLPIFYNVNGLDSASLAELNDSHTDRGGGVVLDDEITGIEGFKVVEKSVSNTSTVEKRSGDFDGNTFRSTH